MSCLFMSHHVISRPITPDNDRFVQWLGQEGHGGDVAAVVAAVVVAVGWRERDLRMGMKDVIGIGIGIGCSRC